MSTMSHQFESSDDGAAATAGPIGKIALGLPPERVGFYAITDAINTDGDVWVGVLEAAARIDTVIAKARTRLLTELAQHPLPAGWSWEFQLAPIGFDEADRFTVIAVPVQHQRGNS